MPVNNFYRLHNRENAVLLMDLLGLKELSLSEIPSIDMRSKVRGENKFAQLGRLTVFYADGTVKTFFSDSPQSFAQAKPREPSEEELQRIVPYLRSLMRERVIEDMIDARMRDHAARDPEEEP